jgi:putative hemolysin
LLFLFIFINAFFSLAEKSVIASKKCNLEKMTDEPTDSMRESLAIVENPLDTLTALQIGMTSTGLVNGIIAGIYLSPAIEGSLPLFEGYAVPLSFALSFFSVLYLTLVLGKLVPRNLALTSPEKILCRMSAFLTLLTKIFRLPSAFLASSADAFLKFFGFSAPHESQVTEDDIMELIEQGTEDGTFEKTEQDMVDNIFHLSDQKAYALMTPRTQLVWIDIEDSLETNLKIIRENPETVFPVAKDNLDEFVGMLYTKDLIGMLLDKTPIDLEKCIHTPVFIPKSMHSFKVLEQFRESGIHEAMVLDEFGGVVGMITMRDIINEVVGDAPLIDEEVPAINILRRDEHTWLVDGLVAIDDFKEHFHISEMPEENRDHYQTLGGFITSYLTYIPNIAENFTWDRFKFEIISMDRARVDKILITELPDFAVPADADSKSDIAS